MSSAPTACPMCQTSASFDVLWALPDTERPFEVVVCPCCGHGLRKQLRSFDDNIDLQRTVFDATTPERETRWTTRTLGRHALVARCARQLVPASGGILDIGCGSGDWLAQWKGRSLFGVDVSARAAEITRRNTGAEVFCGPIEDYAHAPTSLALISALALIEHLTEPEHLISWAFDHLRPGGILLLMTGDRESSVASHLGGHWPLYEPEEHVHFFSARSLTRLLQRFGFSLRRAEWRPMLYSRTSFTDRVTTKLEELTGRVTAPYYDHMYLYAVRQ